MFSLSLSHMCFMGKKNLAEEPSFVTVIPLRTNGLRGVVCFVFGGFWGCWVFSYFLAEQSEKLKLPMLYFSFLSFLGDTLPHYSPVGRAPAVTYPH